MISYLLNLLRWLMQLVQSWLQRRTASVVTLDTGRRVSVLHQIAEGGFSYVFQAVDADDNETLYALKRIRCPDAELVQACRDEAAVHRSVQHDNLMPLLGLAFGLDGNSNDVCYMLFPYCPYSLREAVNRRMFPRDHTISHPMPWPELTVLQLFHSVCSAVQALHEHDYTHRDVKLENVLLADNNMLRPVLMDFGSAGPLTVPLPTRRHCLVVAEQAAMHTTVSYRPPELFEGGVRAGEDEGLDYRACDVWSLACCLHAVLYGASPTECEFSSTGIKIVECTHLSVLQQLPVRPPAHSACTEWYSDDLYTALLEPMLVQDRRKRPALSDILKTIEQLIASRQQSVPRHGTSSARRNSFRSGSSSSSSNRRHPTSKQEGYHSDDGIALVRTDRIV